MWGQPRRNDLQEAMRRVYADPDRAHGKARRAQRHVSERFAPGKIAAQVETRLRSAVAVARQRLETLKEGCRRFGGIVAPFRCASLAAPEEEEEEEQEQENGAGEEAEKDEKPG